MHLLSAPYQMVSSCSNLIKSALEHIIALCSKEMIAIVLDCNEEVTIPKLKVLPMDES